MINGTHILFYSTDADADRAFLRDVLGFRGIDVGGGWMIFKAPPAEAAVHPMEGEGVARAQNKMLGATIHFMCDDVRAMVRSLEAKNVKCAPLGEEPWGIHTAITLPSGGQIGLYQPKHQVAYNLK